MEGRHLSTPVSDGEEVRLEDAIAAYEAWSRDKGAYVETDDPSVTHNGFESLLAEMRNSGVEMESVTLSRLVDRFSSIDSHILNEDEVRRLIKRYPDVTFDRDWDHINIETADTSVDLVFRGEEGDELLLVEIAFETNPRRALGNLLYNRERFDELFQGDIDMCLVALEADDYLRGACDMSDVMLLELGPEALINRVEKSADWGNLRGLTLSP
jgi:hypothetical protein